MAERQPLRGLPAPGAVPGPREIFCGHCGKPPSDGLMPEVGSRVCRRCNLGLLLDAPAATVPKPNEAFVVVDGSLAICGLSRRAERLLGVNEVDAVDRRLTELLVSADAESSAGRPRGLDELLMAATAGAEDLGTVVLRPADEFGVRFVARVGPCGPTPSAVVILDLG
jgi:hypothetical protein